MQLKKPRIHLKCKYLEKLKQQGLCQHARGELMDSPGLSSAPGRGKSQEPVWGRCPMPCPARTGAWEHDGAVTAGAEPSEQLCLPRVAPRRDTPCPGSRTVPVMPKCHQLLSGAAEGQLVAAGTAVPAGDGQRTGL